MVFSTTNLFKGIECPEGNRCSLTSCVFAHELPPPAPFDPEIQPRVITETAPNSVTEESIEPPAKRRRVTYDKAQDKPPSRADIIRDQLAKERHSLTKTPPTPAPLKITTLATLERPVSPPAKGKTNASPHTPVVANNKANVDTTGATKRPLDDEKLTLNPRLIPHDPAGHAKRLLYLKHLHEEMCRLNREMQQRKHVQYKAGLVLTDNELVRLSLDEEEKVAREQGNVYANVIKNRIGAYRKMKVDDWIVHLMSTPLFAKKHAATAQSKNGLDPAKVVDTGLTPEQEVALLPRLVIKDQTSLAAHGYIPTPPTQQQAAEAAAAVNASKNFEECDRCSARFQVWPQRNEDGLLTSNGKCRYHPQRKVFPQKTKADTGPKEPYHPCCNEPVGTPGCTVSEHHVFKVSSPARLAAVMPFIITPENDSPAKDRQGKMVHGIAFDCEMGYTTLGMEVIRLTAVSWPSGEELIDVLVRPLGIVLDLNTRFSGVTPADMANALAYNASDNAIPPLANSQPPPAAYNGSNLPTRTLPIVSSPAAARALLCTYLTPRTPLIGHAIDNDLNVIRLCHPSIIDTVILYNHPRGLPMRYGLKMLSSKYLSRSIQQSTPESEAMGHDSLEDARATGDLVRLKVAERWKGLRSDGWKWEDGRFVPPAASKVADGAGVTTGAVTKHN